MILLSARVLGFQSLDYLAPRGLAFYRERGSDARYFETPYLRQLRTYNCTRNRRKKTKGKLSNPRARQIPELTSSRSLYTRNFHGKWKAKLAANYPRVGRKSRIRGDRGDTYHLEIFLLNLRKESLSKVLDSQVFNDSIIPRPGMGRSRPMTRAIGHGSKVWPKRCNECHCTRPVLRRGSTCDAKRGGKKGRRKRDAVARERETKRDLIHRDACHSMSRVRFYG